MFRPPFLAMACLALPVPAWPDAAVLDQGVYVIQQNGQPVGTEEFNFESHGDSLVILAEVKQRLKSSGGEVESVRRLQVVVSAFDYEIRDYLSEFSALGRTRKRGVVPGDTTFTVYREDERGGEGLTFPRPPGRYLILEPGIFSLFDLAVRNLGPTSFERREVPLLILSSRDTVVTAQVKRIGKERVRWGYRPVLAERFRLDDGQQVFDLWTHPQGHLIRLTCAGLNLRVEREAPAVKPAAKRGTSPG